MTDTPNDNTIGAWVSRNFATGLVVLTLFGNIVGQWALLSDKAKQIEAIQIKQIEMLVKIATMQERIDNLRDIVLDMRREQDRSDMSLDSLH